MAADHADLVDISIALEGAPLSQAGFGRVAYFAEDVAFGGGERAKIYESNQAAQDDTDLTSAAKEAAKVAFSQDPQPNSFMVADVDVTGAETYEEAFNDAVAKGFDFYGVTTESRAGSDALSMAGAVGASSKRAIYLAQSDDADWLANNTVPAAYSGIESNDRTAIVFHDTGAEKADVAALASRLTFDPDEQSAAFQGALNAVKAYAAAIEDGQESGAESNNVNLVLPFGNEPQYFSPGVMITAKPMYELVTRDWFEARLRERLVALKLQKDAAGEKIPLSPAGQSIIASQIEAQFEQGVIHGHFLPESTDVQFPDPIPDSDIQAQVLKASGSAQFATNAASFDLSFNFTRV